MIKSHRVHYERREDMFYEISNTVKPVGYREIKNSESIYVGIITLKELEEIYEFFDFSESTLTTCRSENKNMQNTIAVYDDYSFGIINVIDSKDIHKSPDKVAFYIMSNLFLIVDIFDEDKSTISALDMVLARTKQNKVTLEKIIYNFLSRLIFEENIEIENLELKISKLEKQVFSNEIKNFNDELLLIQKKLSTMRNYYEQLVNIGEDLMENENDIFQDENLRYFKMFTNRVDRLSNNIQMLRDYVSQVREAYQAQMDYNINNIMKVFTVVTTIFLPLTLIIGWYGMNFEFMPEITWRYGYLGVVFLSIVVVILCIIWFKKKKLM
ncbi:MAG TPA: magnesium transporter [Lachnoclostridium phytofermentans]|uniref:Magnesium transporter n=2 Tax=Lachnoclostridium TaxID=1506553 RepID=A0A3D2XAL1_9FIRM|nr:magnesium transporter [Lachnoclostridium phytofermentans]